VRVLPALGKLAIKTHFAENPILQRKFHLKVSSAAKLITIRRRAPFREIAPEHYSPVF